LLLWLQNFLVGDEELVPKDNRLQVSFAALRKPHEELHFLMVRACMDTSSFNSATLMEKNSG
jgi:hypothetical protein